MSKNVTILTTIIIAVTTIGLAIITFVSAEAQEGTVHVYVFDSGINRNHTQFNNNVIFAYDAIQDGQEACHDHGTGAASLIAGETFGQATEATNVALHSIRVLDCNLMGRTGHILDALNWVAENAEYPAVVNMSLGAYDSDVYNEAVETLIAKGITVVTAAGNTFDHDSCTISPANANGVITVASVDANNSVADFTAMGGCVDIFAPGVDITMADNTTDGTWTHSGTSYSAPIVTGCIANFLYANPAATPSDVHTALLASANSIVNGASNGTTTNVLNCTL